MTKKLKGRANPLSELHFIADISLEQAVMLVGDLADDTRIVTITEVDSDSFKFEVNDSRESSRQSKINGTLQRWQGTETRVECNGEVFKNEQENNILAVGIILEFLLLIAIPSLIIAKQSLRNGD